jgi:peptide-methionine (S)-S-oxide reductase
MSSSATGQLKPSELVPDFPDPAIDIPAAPGAKMQSAVLAGGCFWCTEAVYERLEGVKEVTSGYAGGTAETANYEAVSSGLTEHAESIRIVFDPAKISYGQILKIFFSVAHDPTQLNRQGPDWGRQYRSAIFYADEQQKKVAEAYIAQLNAAKVFDKKIVTEVVPLKKFYPAEGYHQDFVRRNPRQPYVVVNALPKVEKLKKQYPDRVKKP